MKLIQINSTYNVGSTGRIVEGIAVAARRRGHLAKAVYGRRAGTGPTETFRIGSAADTALHGVMSIAADGHGLGSKRATKRLTAWLDEEDPDIVGLHNLHGYYINVPLVFEYLASKKIPVLWTLHDCWAFTGHCSYFDRVSCERWIEGCHACPMTSFYPRSFVDRSERNWEWKKALLRDFRNLTIITPSHWLAGLVGQSFLGAHPVHVIHNGVDLEVFQPKAKRRSKSVLGVAHVWDDRKGLMDFIALRQVLSDEWEIKLVGLEKKQIRELPRGVTGIERTSSPEELAVLYSEATAFVNPTYSDNFPTTNIEALACGTPIVTYRTGGSPEAVSVKTGRVVDRGDVAGLAAALYEIASVPGDPWTQACRDHAVANFSAADRFADYVGLAESLVEIHQSVAV